MGTGKVLQVAVVTVDDLEEPTPPWEGSWDDSIAFLCPTCGEVWCRIRTYVLRDDELLPTAWTARSCPCTVHGGGSIDSGISDWNWFPGTRRDGSLWEYGDKVTNRELEIALLQEKEAVLS